VDERPTRKPTAGSPRPEGWVELYKCVFSAQSIMVLEWDWARVGFVALPFLTSACIVGVFAVLLRRAVQESGLPRRREPCVNCLFESALLRDKSCRLRCAVNAVPDFPFALFVVTGTLALFFLFFPGLALAYVLPTVSGLSTIEPAMLTALIVGNVAASLVIAAYFLQDLSWHRETFLRGAAVGSLAALVVGIGAPGLAGSFAQVLAPVGLGALLLAVALEHRARLGRPVFGLRTVAVASLPLYLVTLLAFFRILQVVRAATG
jgi:hypothetical protein